MADIVLTGAGICGLNTAMLLAGDGHHVTVLERDPSPPPAAAAEAWAEWERRGVNQFRQLHLFLSRFRILLERELPEAVTALEEAGCLRVNLIASARQSLTGGPREGDDRFELLTGRRPTVEAALACLAEVTPGVTVRRGAAVAGLITSGRAQPGVPHAVGVVTEAGEEIRADLVVDTTGRRSPLPRWLQGIDARAPYEEREDCGFVYFTRTFRSRDGSLPIAKGRLLQHYDSVSTLTAPADNGTWALSFVTSSQDNALRALRDVEFWMAAWRSYRRVAHWLDGEPIDPHIRVMAKIEDRYRRFVVDGRPVATGVLALGDSWACTNPSAGRGASLGLLHAVALRDLLRSERLDDPVAFALAWDEVSESEMAPWYRETLWNDRHRLGEIEASIQGEPYEPEEPKYELWKAMGLAASFDSDVIRAAGRNALVLSPLDDVIEDVGAERLLSLGGGWRDAPPARPTRDELLKVLGA